MTQGNLEAKIQWRRQKKGSPKEVTSEMQPAEGDIDRVAGAQVGAEPAAYPALPPPRAEFPAQH